MCLFFPLKNKSKVYENYTEFCESIEKEAYLSSLIHSSTQENNYNSKGWFSILTSLVDKEDATKEKAERNFYIKSSSTKNKSNKPSLSNLPNIPYGK